MKGPALKIVKTSAKFCCHLYSRGCEAERQLAVGGGSRHGAQPWAGRGGSEDCSCSGGCIAVTRGCVRGGGRHHHPAQHPAPTPGCRLANFSGCSAGDTAGAAALQHRRLSVPAPRRAARPSPAAATAPQYVKICACLVIFGQEYSVH